MADRRDVLMPMAFADRTAKWAPFALVVVVMGIIWGTTVWDQQDVELANILAVSIGGLMLVGIFLQGWAFWRGEVETLATDGQQVEIRTARWVGWGRRLSFAAEQMTGWAAEAKSQEKATDTKVLARVSFVVDREKLWMSMLAPQVVDLEALSRLAPAFFAQLRLDYPALASVGAGSAA